MANGGVATAAQHQCQGHHSTATALCNVQICPTCCGDVVLSLVTTAIIFDISTPVTQCSVFEPSQQLKIGITQPITLYLFDISA